MNLIHINSGALPAKVIQELIKIHRGCLSHPRIKGHCGHTYPVVKKRKLELIDLRFFFFFLNFFKKKKKKRLNRFLLAG